MGFFFAIVKSQKEREEKETGALTPKQPRAAEPKRTEQEEATLGVERKSVRLLPLRSVPNLPGPARTCPPHLRIFFFFF